MARQFGQSSSLSLARRNVCDFLHASLKVPSVTFGRTMSLSAVVAARHAAKPRPSWCGIFTKAFAITASRRIELRRAYLGFPWQRLYDHPVNIASVIVEKELNGELVLVPALIANPETIPLTALDEIISRVKQDPLKEEKAFRRSMILARYPRAIRRLVWWYGLNVSGYKRSRWFGTFGVSSVARFGVDSLRPLSPWPSLLHYGVIDPRGTMTARLTFDHRIFDGTVASMALMEFEKALHDEILAELISLRSRAAA